MRKIKKDEIVNVLFTIFLVMIQQLSLLYIILNNTNNYLYFSFLAIDIYLCIYMIWSLYDYNNAGVKISIEWMIYMITLSLKMIIFCFVIIQIEKAKKSDNPFFIYLGNDALVYNLIYMTPFIYLLFSLRSRNILEYILSNQIIIENILSIDVNIINLFDIIDLTFMYSHLTTIYKILSDSEYHNIQKVYIMLVIVIVSMLLFAFYFPIYTNIEKSYSYDDIDTNFGVKNKIIRKKRQEINYQDNFLKNENRLISRKPMLSDTKGGQTNGNETGMNNISRYVNHAKTFLNIYDSNKKPLKMANTIKYKNNDKSKISEKKILFSSSESMYSQKSLSTTPSSFYSQNNSNNILSESVFSSTSSSNTSAFSFEMSDYSKSRSHGSSMSSSSSQTSSSHSSNAPISAYLPSFFSFTSKNRKNNNSYNKKYRDVYTDVYITAKFHFIVGFFLIDVPFLIYRLYFCIKYKVILTLVIKNVLFLLFRSFKLNEYRLVEKEKHKKNKSNFDFHFYTNENGDSESNDYTQYDDLSSSEKSQFFYKNKKSLLLDDRNIYKRWKYRKSMRTLKNKTFNEMNKMKSKKEYVFLKKKNNNKKYLKKKKKKKIDILDIFKEEFQENKQKIILEKIAMKNKEQANMNTVYFDKLGNSISSAAYEKGPNNSISGQINNSDLYNYDNDGYDKFVKNGENKESKNNTKVRFSWREKIELRKKYKTFINLIYKLKYKREIPIYRLTIMDHITELYNFIFKKFNCSNYIFFDDKLVFSYFTNMKFMLIIFLDYLLKIGVTIFFLFILLNNHTFINENNIIYFHDIPINNNATLPLTFPQNFDLSKYPNIQVPDNPINIKYINKDIGNAGSTNVTETIPGIVPNGYLNLNIRDNIFTLKWSEIFIYDKIYLYACMAYFVLYFILLIKASTFFDILFAAIFNTIRNLSYYFSLKQFILFFYTFNGNIYNKNYIYQDMSIRKLNSHYEYYFILFFNIHYFISFIKHISLYLRILFNFKYVYYYRNIPAGEDKKKNELRYSISSHILFLLCKYSYAPVNLNTLLLGENILSNIILIDNINGFTWVNIIVVILFKGIQILMTKVNYFLIGLFLLHIILYITYAIHAQILRYIILRKIEILFAFKKILISNYEEIPLVPDDNSSYITCRDILKYYSEEGFFSSEGNIIPNFI
ncbi:conserved Plasmodium protein, unknown function [Plasmodium vinckei brucechwatti]|uniref:Uncharacterized protein n=1 Tax=Plasmodium vinckei brucechwatti TaxID=119398 RepID=A0A6V7S2E5_PLAVN|nr:conserved Plasmodium protein, unknown function [Plasmodium vinckei brucechwatti]